MSHDIKESDWKVLRQLHAIAIERFSSRIISEIQAITSAPDRSAHERYVDVLALIRKRRPEMENAFDDMRRSRALQRLLAIQSHDLLTKDELERFSPEMRESLRAMLEIFD
jgi:flagellar basal body-associated protein FliL